MTFTVYFIMMMSLLMPELTVAVGTFMILFKMTFWVAFGWVLLAYLIILLSVTLLYSLWVEA